MSPEFPNPDPLAGTYPGAGRGTSLGDAQQRVGSTLPPDWRLDAVLGVGGMATVYAATSATGQRAAVKILQRALAGDAAIRGRFEREARIAKKVAHPGVARIDAIGQTDEGEPFLVMELLQGQTLEKLWHARGKRLPVTQALRIARGTLDALGACHRHGIVHRDLKPGNLWVTRAGGVKLLDFGVARYREPGSDITGSGVALGTPAYMSPEQAMGRRQLVDVRSDVFALGATLYATLSGVRLHEGLGDHEAQVRAATQPAPSLARVAPELPVGVIALVDRALQWDRRNRYQNAAQMCAAVDALLAELGGELPEEVAPPAPAPAVVAEAEPATPGVELELELDLPPALAQQLSRSAAGGSPSPTAAEELPMAAPTNAAAPRPAAPSLDAALELDARLEIDLPVKPRASPVPPVARQAAVGVETPVALGTEFTIELDDQPHGEHAPATTVPAPAVASAPAPAPAAARPSSQGAGRPGAARPDEAQARGAATRPEGTEEPTAHAVSPHLVPIFERLDRLLRTARQYGPAHPETQSRLAPVYQAVTEALAEGSGSVRWRVLPFCFSVDEAVAWEPPPPGDLVPYLLSVAGLREVTLSAGVTEAEVYELLRAMMVDATTDPADLAFTLWEIHSSHLECRLEEDLAATWADEDSQLGDWNDELTRELERANSDGEGELQSLARALGRSDAAEAAAMAAVLEQVHSGVTAALGLDEAMRRALAAKMSLESDAVADRHSAVLLAALVDAGRRRDLGPLAATFSGYANRLIRTGRLEELFALHGALLAQCAERRAVTPQTVTAVVFQRDVLRSVALAVSAWAQQLPTAELAPYLEGLGRVTSSLGRRALPGCIDTLRELPDGPVLELLTSYVERVAPGQESAIVAELPSLGPRTAQRLLARLAASGSEAMRAELQALLNSPDATLRCEAIAALSPSSAELAGELLKLYASSNPEARAAALETFVRHRITTVGPALVRIAQDEAFVRKPAAEQEQLLDALQALHPRRTESLLVELLGRHGLMADPVLDELRCLAAAKLGQWGESAEAAEALSGATRLRPWNGHRLREAASAALGAVAQRAAASGGRQGGGA